VDDGICDCCDGTDEGHVVTCPNRCKEEGNELKELLAEKVSYYELALSWNKDKMTSTVDWWNTGAPLMNVRLTEFQF